jgi:hypothetical protein
LALGVVFGDIGTSPLYALRETFFGRNPVFIDLPSYRVCLRVQFLYSRNPKDAETPLPSHLENLR